MRVLVIDVGGTEIKYAAANTSLDLMGYGKIKTPYETGVEGFLDVLEGIYRKFEGIVSGVSVSLPGLIDDQNGCCISGGSLEYNVGKPLGKLQMCIRDRCKGIRSDYCRPVCRPVRGCNIGNIRSIPAGDEFHGDIKYLF